MKKNILTVALLILTLALALAGTVGAANNIGIYDRLVVSENSAMYPAIYTVQSGGALAQQWSNAAGEVARMENDGDFVTVGDISMDDLAVGDDLGVTGDLSSATLAVGGGYGGTGCSISAGGLLQCNGNGDFGGGYGDTGCSIADATGNLQCDGDLQTDGDVTIGGQILSGTGVHVLAGDGIDNIGTFQTTGDSIFYTGYVDVQGDLEDSTGALTIDDDVDIALDLTMGTSLSGGNAGDRVQIEGLPRIAMAFFGVGTDATAAGKTLRLEDANPAGEFLQSDGDVTCADDAVNYREAAASLSMLFSADSDPADSCHDAVGATDWTDDESVGFWWMCDQVTALGDFQFVIADDGGDHAIDIPAGVADVWQWVDLTAGVTAIANADKDVITDYAFEITAAGVARAVVAPITCNVDAIYKWDATEEEALPVGILQDGVLAVWGVLSAAISPDDQIQQIEYTDYFVHYQAGADAIVWITDEDSTSNMALYAY